MKKVIIVALALVLAFTFASCSFSDIKEAGENVIANYEDMENNVELDWGDVEEEETSKLTSSAKTPEWREFLKEYEEWVDDYIVMVKKYSDNPTDMSIMMDYMEMVTDLAEWSTKTEEMEEELENASSDELIEYANELARIAAKLAKAAS